MWFQLLRRFRSNFEAFYPITTYLWSLSENLSRDKCTLLKYAFDCVASRNDIQKAKEVEIVVQKTISSKISKRWLKVLWRSFKQQGAYNWKANQAEVFITLIKTINFINESKLVITANGTLQTNVWTAVCQNARRRKTQNEALIQWTQNFIRGEVQNWTW